MITAGVQIFASLVTFGQSFKWKQQSFPARRKTLSFALIQVSPYGDKLKLVFSPVLTYLLTEAAIVIDIHKCERRKI